VGSTPTGYIGIQISLEKELIMARIDRLTTLKQFFIDNKEEIEKYELFSIVSWSEVNAELVKRRHGFISWPQVRAEIDKILLDLHPDDLVTPFHICGTTACVLGWAGYIPEFRKGGLVTVVGRVKYTECPSYDSFEAGMIFFEISKIWAYFLFTDDWYPRTPVTIDDVIEQIQKVIDYYENHEGEDEFYYREQLYKSVPTACDETDL
jgi:hypothetical protein